MWVMSITTRPTNSARSHPVSCSHPAVVLRSLCDVHMVSDECVLSVERWDAKLLLHALDVQFDHKDDLWMHQDERTCRMSITHIMPPAARLMHHTSRIASPSHAHCPHRGDNSSCICLGPATYTTDDNMT